MCPNLSRVCHLFHQLNFCLNIFHQMQSDISEWFCKRSEKQKIISVLFPKVSSSALSLIFNINDGILRILIGRAMLGPCIQIGKISASARIGAQKHQHQLGLELNREELTVEPAFAKMSGEPSIWTEGTAKYISQSIWKI